MEEQEKPTSRLDWSCKPMSRHKREQRGGPVISGVIMLGLGLYLLSMQIGVLPSIDKSWPSILVIVGVALIVGAFSKKQKPADHQDQQPLS